MSDKEKMREYINRLIDGANDRQLRSACIALREILRKQETK